MAQRVTDRPCRRAQSSLRRRTTGMAMLLVGCSGTTRTPSATTSIETVRRDSAGVQIVEHRFPADGEPRRLTWTVDPLPILAIGTVEGDTAQELSRVTGAQLLTGGRLAVGLGDSYEVRIFDSTGTLLRTIGRRGNGPGEFRSVTGLWRLEGDRLAVYDIRLRRLSVFDADGQLLRSTRYEPQVRGDAPAVLGRVVGFTDDRTAVAFAETIIPDRFGLKRAPRRAVLLDSGGGVRVAVDSLLGQETFSAPAGPSGRFAMLALPPFGKNTLAAAGQGRLAIASNDEYEIRLYRTDGTLAMVLRADVQGATMTREDVRGAAEAQTRGRSGAASEQAVTMMEEMSVHERLPVLRSLHMDGAGRLWAEEFRRPSDAGRRVAVFGNDGGILGSFFLAGDMEIVSIGDRRVVVLTRSVEDTEAVSVLRLVEDGG